MTRRGGWSFASACLRAHGISLLALVYACSPETTAEPERASSVAPAEVVARVNGSPITLTDVRELLRVNPMPGRDALRLLIDAEILAQHAEQQGYGERAAVRREARAAAVRTLLQRTVAGADTVEVQHERYRQLVVGLEEHAPIHIDEEGVARVLGDPEIWRQVVKP